MSAKNNCNFVGNIGRDCEVRHTANGTAVASFPLPIESGYGDNKVVSWVRCSVFGKRAEGGLVKYLVKGQQVAVTGEIKLNVYTSKDGVEKTSLDMNVGDIALLGSRQPEQQVQQPVQQQVQPQADPFANQPGNPNVVDDDIPF